MAVTVRILRRWLDSFNDDAEIIVVGNGFLVNGIAAFGESRLPTFAPTGFDKVALMTGVLHRD